MPWQLSGNGRSDWSTKLIRGLKAEAAAGFKSRRERCGEPTPATPQYAAFSTYKAARVEARRIASECIHELRGSNPNRTVKNHQAGGSDVSDEISTFFVNSWSGS